MPVVSNFCEWKKPNERERESLFARENTQHNKTVKIQNTTSRLPEKTQSIMLATYDT